MKFKELWKEKINKTHDVPIQEELDEVKDDVHEMDERLDQYEDAKGNPKKMAKFGQAATPPSGLSDNELRERGFIKCPQCGQVVDYSHQDEHMRDKHNINKSQNKFMIGDIDGKPLSVFLNGVDVPQFEIDGKMLDTFDQVMEYTGVSKSDTDTRCRICNERLPMADRARHLQEKHPDVFNTRYMGSLPDFFDKARAEKGMKKMGIGTAGPVPNSQLADQNLEPDKDEQDAQKSIKVEYQGSNGKVYHREFNTKSAYNSFISTVGDQIEIIDVEGLDTTKGVVEQTGKDLDTIEEKAKDSEGEDDQGLKDSLAERIVSVQQRRQKGIISARKKEARKSFKQSWIEKHGQ